MGARFVEVYMCADIKTCEARDKKGVYAKARAVCMRESFFSLLLIYCDMDFEVYNLFCIDLTRGFFEISPESTTRTKLRKIQRLCKSCLNR